MLFQVSECHPGLRGVGGPGQAGVHTPLAMLAAQCNKLQQRTPPPLADAAVGKGFHPWKKSGSSQSGQSDESSGAVSSRVSGHGAETHSGPASPASAHSSQGARVSPASHPSLNYHNTEAKSAMPCAEPSLALYPGYTPSSTPTKLSQPTCQALYDFEPENAGELGFKEGDMITLKQKVDDNWFEGTFQGKTGFFPINYVSVLVPLP